MTDRTSQIATILATAQSKLKSAEILLEAGQWADAVSRSYYVVYHAISAVLITRDLVFSSHSQTISMFNKEFVKSGLFPKDFGRLLVKMQMDRETADYRVATGINEDRAREDIETAKKILAACHQYLQSRS